MTLGDYLYSVMEEEHRVNVAHLDAAWNEPSRADHYAMQIAAMLSTGSGGLDRFRIRFERVAEEADGGEEVALAQRAAMISALAGGADVEVRLTRAEAAEIAALPAGEAAARRRQIAEERGKKRMERKLAERRIKRRGAADDAGEMTMLDLE